MGAKRWQNPLPFPLVGVAFRDHSSKSDWTDVDEIHEELQIGLVYIVGWLVKETDKSYVITPVYQPQDKDTADAWSVIKGAVVEFKVLAKAGKATCQKK